MPLFRYGFMILELIAGNSLIIMARGALRYQLIE